MIKWKVTKCDVIEVSYSNFNSHYYVCETKQNDELKR